MAYQGVDVGPSEEMSENRFNLLAFRCGRILEGDMQVSGLCCKDVSWTDICHVRPF